MGDTTKKHGSKRAKRPKRLQAVTAEASKIEDAGEMGSRGRPTLYTEEIRRRVCELLGDGKSLTSICDENPDLPSDRTIRRWALDPEHPFSPHYARAREVGYHKMADDGLDIADDGTNDYRTGVKADGSTVTVVDHDHIARSRLRVEYRKWLLSKALPKIYGDKLELGGNLTLTHEDRLKAIEDAANGKEEPPKSDE